MKELLHCIRTHCCLLGLLLITLLQPQTHFAQTLTLYVIPPNRPMNWSSPKKLLFSYINSCVAKSNYKDFKHPLGHVMVELNDSTRHVITGMVAQSTKAQMQMVKNKGYGLGVLTAIAPGKLRENTPNANDLLLRYPKGDVAFIRYQLSHDNFNRLWTYLEEYKNQGFDSMYNGDNKPREGKGAGCSAFGVSFLELAKLLTPEQEQAWQMEVPIQASLLGGPKHEHRFVRWYKIAFTNHWAKSTDSNTYTIRFFEPKLMYAWIQKQHDDLLQAKHGLAQSVNNLKAKGFVIDCTYHSTINEPIWLLYHTEEARRNWENKTKLE